MNLNHLVTSVFLLTFLSSCALPVQYSSITIMLSADESVNEGILLPVDIMAAEASVIESILQVGPDEWFGDNLRERLTGEEINKIAIKSGQTKEMKIRIKKGSERIVIFADFENNNDRYDQQIVIIPKQSFFLPRYNVKIRENKMELPQ